MRAIAMFLFLALSTPITAQSVTQSEIIQVQGLLADMGYRAEVGSVDGVMGPGTSTAISAFQRDMGKRVTGQPSAELIVQLRRLHGHGWDRGKVLATGPSFDCDRASSPAEKGICSDARLSRRDRDVAKSYAAALARSSQKDSVRASQREWIGRRNSCGGDIRCLDNAMTGQISILGRF
ncbi:peptidoglycan-binding protein [Neptunicoccus cionae]|uniref:peptidoglycan-binding protein n=1 Tax=Neptunicoccus cionae TaxID=2035344 RepID=UPI00166BC026|nr:peptidoglycan-binding protein [Amylibacter cionae]